MKYRNKQEAKEYAKKNMKGAWGASYTPYTPDYKLDEDAFRHNIRHCVEIGIDGMFLNGLMGEAFYQTIAERKLTFKMAVEEAQGKMDIMPYTSDPSVENVLEMTKYCQDIGADYVIIINPMFYLGPMNEEGLFQYYKYVADRVDIGIALFNQMEHNYLMSPRLIARLAEELPNLVAIKHTGPRTEVEATRVLCGDKIVVSDPGEDNWLFNIIVNKQEAMIAGPPPYTLQSKKLRLIKDYTNLAVGGRFTEAWAVSKRLEPIRQAMQKVIVPGRTHAVIKYWTQFLGMVGGDGRVRAPEMGLTEAQKEAVKAAVLSTELVGEPVAAR